MNAPLRVRDEQDAIRLRLRFSCAPALRAAASLGASSCAFAIGFSLVKKT
jgi:hypothetical protein